MSKSNYAHFQRAVRSWRDRSDELARFKKRAQSVIIDGIPGTSLDNEALLQHADVLAQRIIKQNRPKANSDLIRNIGRLLLYREIESRTEPEVASRR